MAKKVTAKTLPMRALEEKGVTYQTLSQSRKQYTALGVAEDLGVPVAQVVKAMLVTHSEGHRGAGGSAFALVVIPGDRRLSLKKVGPALGDKNVSLAPERDVERVTGFQVGAVSALGLRREDVPTYLDHRILDLDQVVLSSGRPDVGLALSPEGLLQAANNPFTGDFCEDE